MAICNVRNFKVAGFEIIFVRVPFVFETALLFRNEKYRLFFSKWLLSLSSLEMSV